jgi:hypothetical protein
MITSTVIAIWLAMLWVYYFSGARQEENYRAIWLLGLVLAGIATVALPVFLLAIATPPSPRTSPTSGPTAPLEWIPVFADAAGGIIGFFVIHTLLALAMSGFFLLIYLLLWGRPVSGKN